MSEASKLPKCQVCGDDAEIKYIHRRGGVIYRCRKHRATLGPDWVEKDLRGDIQLTLEGEVEDRFLGIKREMGLTDDAEVLRRIFNQYLVNHVLVDPGFVEWFRARHPRPGGMKLSEVVEEHELYKRQKATPQAF